MRTFLKLLVVAVTGVVLFGVISIWQLNSDAAKLPSRALPLTEIAVNFKEDVPTRRFIRTNNTYFEVLLTGYSTSATRSGPTAYVYRSDGVLEDWALDRGEASEFVKRWGEFNEGDRITLKQAVDQVRSSRK
jgi:hypothetical protein